MNDGYVKTDPWRLVEDRFDPSRALSSESLFALGNGVMGGRANFEERYSGETLQGNYIGGVYYPDKTRVGWWKNGYPEYFAKVPNAAFWIGVDVAVDGEPLDLATVAEVKSFYREMDMRRSVLTRRMRVVLKNGVEVAVETVRFLSLARRELGVVKYAVTPLNRAARITFSPHVDADVRNADANYDEKFWEEVSTEADATQSRTKKSGFEAAWAQAVELDGAEWHCETRPEKVRATAAVSREKGCAAVLYKYAGICSSLNHAPADLIAAARAVATSGQEAGFEALLEEQTAAWAARWHGCDIEIGGDARAQQGIRFCIFMLLQTYTGVDTRLNIGPKGFTGEKYGGVTYWDTEAYCLPFYLATAGRAGAPAASAVVDNAAENGSDALDGVFNALLEADPISNQFEIAAMNIEYDFGLKAEDVVSYKGVKSNDNGDAGLVLVLEAADGKAEDVANQLASYQQDQVAFYGNYAEFAQAQDNVENAVIAFKGNTIVMVIASNECTADLDSAVDSALAD